MRLSDLNGVEVINMHDGTRIGVINASDLILNEDTGKIEAIMVPSKNKFSIWGNHSEMTIPWEQICKIGSEVIIVDLSEEIENKRANNKKNRLWGIEKG